MPRLESLEHVLHALQEGTFPAFSLREWAESSLVDMLNDHNYGSAFVGLGDGHCLTSITKLKKLKRVVVDDVRHMRNGNFPRRGSRSA